LGWITIANLKCFGAPARQQPNVDGFIYIHYAVPPYSARISANTSSHLAKLRWFPFRLPCATPGNEAEHKIYGGGEISSSTVTRLSTKVHEIFRQYRRPFVLSNAIGRLSIRHIRSEDNSLLSLEIVENPNNYFAHNFWEGQPRLFYGRLLARITVDLDKVWLSSVC